jgi:hypothetical protein
MSEEVRSDLNRGELEVGELLEVEVVRVNGERRMWVRDIPNPVEEGETEAKPQAA